MTLDPQVAAWVARTLGASPHEVFFEARSMSEVWGVELVDGRRVAIKRRGDDGRLAIVAAAHRAADAAGIDTPALLAGPDPVDGDQRLTAEAWRPEGRTRPPRAPQELYARLSARIIAAVADVAAVGLEPPPWMHYDHADPDRVWPPAASSRWDPHRIEADLPPALVRLGRAARARLLAADLPRVLGHADLNGQNVRWVGERAIVHDWDSIAVLPEAVHVGNLAADHVATLEQGAIADVETCAALLAAYEREAGRSFTADETEVAWATTVWLGCYNAAFEHLHGAPGACTAMILADGDARLALAGV
ncbi:phosphotransferase [Demequina lignilytica]|uniref:Phosphotransferase n=1 Tax=Demequina lignilytica TaxID=3051663 RepID=A0AB35MJT1_9MICO|nr:phosphotransferase [Demequina sp. SYSU T0a273]MDN4483895.1 phosphotransferase [Demequina sp. SYSU T0a273]